MIRRPPRSTLSASSAASDVYKRQPWLLPESVSSSSGWARWPSMTQSWVCSLLCCMPPSPRHPPVSQVFLRIGKVAFSDTKLGMFIAKSCPHPQSFWSSSGWGVAFNDTKLGMFIAVWLLLALKSHRLEDKYSNVVILCKCLNIGAVAQREVCSKRGVRLW